MICPFCNHENIDGVDCCDACQAGLSDFDGTEASSDIERELLTRTLGDLIAHDYVEIPSDLPARELVKQLHDHRHHCAIVTEGDRIVGIITERDVLTKLADHFEERAETPVKEFMTPDPVTLHFDDPIVFGLNQMMLGGCRHIPIQRDGKLVGIVSIRNILGYMVERFDEWLPAEVAG